MSTEIHVYFELDRVALAARYHLKLCVGRGVCLMGQEVPCLEPDDHRALADIAFKLQSDTPEDAKSWFQHQCIKADIGLRPGVHDGVLIAEVGSMKLFEFLQRLADACGK